MSNLIDNDPLYDNYSELETKDFIVTQASRYGTVYFEEFRKKLKLRADEYSKKEHYKPIKLKNWHEPKEFKGLILEENKQEYKFSGKTYTKHELEIELKRSWTRYIEIKSQRDSYLIPFEIEKKVICYHINNCRELLELKLIKDHLLKGVLNYKELLALGKRFVALGAKHQAYSCFEEAFYRLRYSLFENEFSLQRDIFTELLKLKNKIEVFTLIRNNLKHRKKDIHLPLIARDLFNFILVTEGHKAAKCVFDDYFNHFRSIINLPSPFAMKIDTTRKINVLAVDFLISQLQCKITVDNKDYLKRVMKSLLLVSRIKKQYLNTSLIKLINHNQKHIRFRAMTMLVKINENIRPITPLYFCDLGLTENQSSQIFTRLRTQFVNVNGVVQARKEWPIFLCPYNNYFHNKVLKKFVTVSGFTVKDLDVLYENLDKEDRYQLGAYIFLLRKQKELSLLSEKQKKQLIELECNSDAQNVNYFYDLYRYFVKKFNL